MWLISIKPNLCVATKQRQGNSEQVVLHMATCWVDPMHIGGAGDCVFMTVMKLCFLQLGRGHISWPLWSKLWTLIRPNVLCPFKDITMNL